MRRNNYKRQERRATPDNANRRLPLESLYNSLIKPSPTLLNYEDRRRWHPMGDYAPARSFNRSQHRIIVGYQQPRKRPQNSNRPMNIRTYPTSSVAFHDPQKVLICVRRQARTEVLHALRKTGKTGQRKPRRNWYSNISCKRN